MAVEYKKFQAEFAKIEQALEKPFGEMKFVGDSEGNTKKLLDGTRLGIGDRVEELKKNAAQGKVLADFASDPQVKAALATAKESLKNYKTLEDRKKAMLASFVKIHKDLLDFIKRLDAEIASRKKKIFEPKSLPDMIKLSKAAHDLADPNMNDVKSQSVGDIVKIKIKDGEYEKTFWAAVDLEIKKKESIRANAAVSDLLEMFKPRLMKLRTDKVIGLALEIEKLCTAATTAKKADNAELAKKALATAVTKCDELHAITSKYDEAFSKNKKFLEQNPDFQTILATVGKMASVENKSLKAVQTAQG